MELVELQEGSSTCLGYCVSLGQRFFTSGIKEVDTTILPHITAVAGPSVIPRVLPSYSLLYWFAIQVSTFYKSYVQICFFIQYLTFLLGYSMTHGKCIFLQP